MIHQTFFGNRILDYLVFLGAFLAAILVIRIFKSVILKHIKAWAKKTETTLDDFLIHTFEKTLLPLLYLGAFYLTINCLTLNPALGKAINVLGAVLLTLFGIQFSVAVITYMFETWWLKREKDASRKQNLRGVLPVIKVIVWGVGITFLLDNLGFKISTVIAGLGIGGVAVALAAQTILGDLFSYFAIMFDRPFEPGDFIIVGDYLGTVEQVGIKTTKIRSLGGEQLIFSNTDLTNSRVRNYKRMEKRRVVFKLGVTYQTPLKQVKEIPGIIANVMKNVRDTTFDRAHFLSYGDFSLIFETVYYVLSSDYNKYMDIQQEINFAIKEEFEKRGIEFAYPTQTLFVQKN